MLSAAGQPTDNLHLDIHPLLVKTADKVLLFDTGAGANFGPGAGKLAASLAEAGIDAQAITDVFISHSHGDHVGGLVNGEGALTFPNATIHLSSAEWKHLSAAENNAALAKAMKPKVKAFAPNAELVPGARESGRGERPHAGPFGLSNHVGPGIPALRRRLDAPFRRFRAEAAVDHQLRRRRQDGRRRAARR